MIKLDARGLSCPEPLLMLQSAIKKNKDEQFELLLSSQNAMANCKKFAESKKFSVEVASEGDDLKLIIK